MGICIVNDNAENVKINNFLFLSHYFIISSSNQTIVVRKIIKIH